MGAFRFFIGF